VDSPFSNQTVVVPAAAAAAAADGSDGSSDGSHCIHVAIASAPTRMVVYGNRVLEDGLFLIGFSLARQNRNCLKTKRRWFRSAFGVGPVALAKLFNDLQELDRENINNLRYFLITINWLASYMREPQMAGFFHADEGTLRGHIADFLAAMFELSALKIRWKDWGSRQFIISVDGVHFRIHEPRMDPSAKWMSYKFMSAGLSYEFAVSLTASEIVWINGPFQASKGDLEIFKECGLADLMGPGQVAIADRGYRGAGDGYEDKLAIRNQMDSDELREYKKLARARHESLNARLKCFEILQTVFRHNISKHESVVHAVALCVQYDMKHGHPLMDL
jgi:hypothetical protein